MAVIINEFEVVTEEPKTPEGAEKPETTAAVQKLSPLDIYDVIRHQAGRAGRILAH